MPSTPWDALHLLIASEMGGFVANPERSTVDRRILRERFDDIPVRMNELAAWSPPYVVAENEAALHHVLDTLHAVRPRLEEHGLWSTQPTW